jgi:hypothetical protein
MALVMLYFALTVLNEFLHANSLNFGYVIKLSIPLISFLFFTTLLWRDAKQIKIDLHTQSISFTNLITRQTKTLLVSEFDGYVETLQKDAYRQDYLVIYLVRNKKFILKLSSFYYSNVAEMVTGLNGIKYLGKKSYGIIQSIKVLFNLPVLIE